MGKINIYLITFILSSLLAAQDNNNGYGFFEKPFLGLSIPHQSVTDSEGNTYITGTSSDENSPTGNIFTIKLNNAGDVEWEAREQTMDFAMEIGHAITLDENNNAIVTGTHWNGENMDIKTIKYSSSDGSVIWSSVFDGGQNGMDYPKAIVSDSSGNVLVAGYSYYGNNSIGYLVVKYGVNGEYLWSDITTSEITGSKTIPSDISVSTNGNIAITGNEKNSDGINQYCTLLYAADGELLWKNNYLHMINDTPANSDARSVSFDSNGDLYVTGTFAIDDLENNKIGTLKYSSTGELMWDTTYQNELTTLKGYQLKISDETIYVSGTYYDLNAFTEGSLLAAYDKTTGAEKWVQKNSDMYVENVLLELDSNSNPVLATLGVTSDFVNRLILISRYSRDGTLTHQQNHQRPNDGGEIVTSTHGMISLGIDNNDYVYITLDTRYAHFGNTYEALKFDQSDNNPDWVSYYSNEGATNTKVKIGKSDNAGNMIMLGQSLEVYDSYNLTTNYFLLKRDSSGDIIWEKEIHSSTTPTTVLMEVNNLNEIIIASVESFSSAVIFRKFASDGNLIWEFEKEIQKAEIAALLIDEENNIYLSGNSFRNNTQNNQQFFAMKLSNEGQEIWDEYAHLTDEDMYLHTLKTSKLDNNGNLISIGSTGTDFITNATAFSISANGNLNWLTPIEIQETISTGVDLDIDDSGNIYALSQAKKITEYNRKFAVAKITSAGTIVYANEKGIEEHDIIPYKIYILPGNRYSVIHSDLVPYQSNKIVVNTFDMDGNELDAVASEFSRFYKDSFLDDLGNIYLLLQVEDSSAFPHRDVFVYSNYIYSSIMKVADNSFEETKFLTPSLAVFFPVNLVSYPDGKLEISGNLSCDLGSYMGIYFFESEYEQLGIENPEMFENTNWLGQNYPNPVNGITSIPFNLTENSEVTIRLFNMEGKFVQTLSKGYFHLGKNTAEINLSGLPKGIYFYQLQSQNFIQSKKVIIN